MREGEDPFSRERGDEDLDLNRVILEAVRVLEYGRLARVQAESQGVGAAWDFQ
ncbi:MAG: hypothetical protein O7B23_04255 [Deltaproteobacteria bacterium]|nr:hypothetical protein [Deltaproteobacteria bacterium]MCZ6714258.1 hypothetical protein [Deltaproteobacteria bacterium]